jgi:hypothetical protein
VRPVEHAGARQGGRFNDLTRRFNLAIERLLLHLGFDDIRLIDGSGDGGDILAHRKAELQERFRCSAVYRQRGTTVPSLHRAKRMHPCSAAMRDRLEMAERS